MVKVEISYYYLDIAYVSGQNFSKEWDRTLSRIFRRVIYIMYVYLTFIHSIYTGDGDDDKVR